MWLFWKLISSLSRSRGDWEHKTTGDRPNRSSGAQALGSPGNRQVHLQKP